MKVRVGSSEGVVPASYVEALPKSEASGDRPASTYSSSSASMASSANTAIAKKKGPAVAPRRGGKKLKYVEAQYGYEARSESEWSMTAGERFVLVKADPGDGWADVEKGGVTKSVPASYIEEVP